MDALRLRQDSHHWLSYDLDGRHVVRSTEWQEAFDQDRRRHEPQSSGFLLEMDVGLLQKWLDEKQLELFAALQIDRSTDRYKPEYDMKWVRCRRIVKWGK